jgi:hypothetical protein
MKKALSLVVVIMLLAGQAVAEEDGFFNKICQTSSGSVGAGGILDAAVILGILGVKAISCKIASNKSVVLDSNKSLALDSNKSLALALDSNETIEEVWETSNSN